MKQQTLTRKSELESGYKWGFETCIDCGACEPECPVEAIFEETEVPEEWDKYIKMNYEFFGQEAP